jgi:cyclophilin family peptidyl-prolyl cis-trans isomerase
MKKFFKKTLCVALAAATVAGGALSMASCTTNHPEVEMVLQFNGKTYTVEYKLYRKIAPNTVNHFLALVENGYYNEKDGQNICVHDYTSSKWYTGAYEYNANTGENGGLEYRNYFSIVSAFENKDYVSVWLDSNKSTPTYTLYGEFQNNGMKMDKGSFVSQSFGSLAMVYESMGSNASEYDVYVERVDGNGIRKTKYEMNSATSMFSINLSGTTDRAHCTFATLQESSVEELKALQEAINEYIEEKFSDNDEEDAEGFTKEVELAYGQGDPFVENAGLSVEYDVPTTPIIIKSIKVLKY